MLPLLVFAIVLLVFEVVVWRYGVDTRDGKDWVAPTATRSSPRRG